MRGTVAVVFVTEARLGFGKVSRVSPKFDPSAPPESKRKAAAGLMIGATVSLGYALLLFLPTRELQFFGGAIVLVWAAWIFRQCAAFVGLGALHIPVSPVGFFSVWLFGALFISGIGPLIIAYTGLKNILVLTKK